MDSSDITIEILKGIRDEIRQTNGGIDRTNERLEELRGDLTARIDGLRDELSRRIVESEVRTASAISALAGSVQERRCDDFQSTGLLDVLGKRLGRCELAPHSQA